MVLVFDDLTELLKAQRLAAWREVAQRIAHEIKNPLTPIQLSAQRLRRRLADGRSPEEKRLLEECTGDDHPGGRRAEAAGRRVLALRAHARAYAQAHRPAARCSKAWSCLYRESHPASRLTRRLSADLPPLEVDPDQIKRAVLNLVDNAVEAVGGTGEVAVRDAHGWPRPAASRIVVADDGPGHPAGGPGAPLPALLLHEGRPAWASACRSCTRSSTDHGGTIRVEDNVPHGSRFVIELPGGRRWPRRRSREGEGGPDGGRAHPDRRRRAGDPERPCGACWRTRAIASPRRARARRRSPAIARRDARPRLPRHLDAGHGRARDPGRAEARCGPTRGGHDLRPRHHRDRGQGHQARAPTTSSRSRSRSRRRCSSVEPRPRARPPRARRTAHAARARSSAARRSSGKSARSSSELRQQIAIAAPTNGPRAHPRRERHGQGAGGPRHPRASPRARRRPSSRSTAPRSPRS